MNRTNKVPTVEFKIRLEPTANRVLEELAASGVFGKNRAEVAKATLWEWIWANQEKLMSLGIYLAPQEKRKRPPS
jgi:hypothetical protein